MRWALGGLALHRMPMSFSGRVLFGVHGDTDTCRAESTADHPKSSSLSPLNCLHSWQTWFAIPSAEHQLPVGRVQQAITPSNVVPTRLGTVEALLSRSCPSQLPCTQQRCLFALSGCEDTYVQASRNYNQLWWQHCGKTHDSLQRLCPASQMSGVWLPAGREFLPGQELLRPLGMWHISENLQI